MKKTKLLNFNAIDIAKLFFSFCIVALHSIATNNYYIINLIFRLAVPFFFVVSGLFFGLKFYENKSELSFITKAYVKRLLLPFILWLGINVFLHRGQYLGINVDNLKRLVQMSLFYPLGALWFVQSCIVGILLLFYFLKRNKLNIAIMVGICLYCFALICNSYYFLADKTFINDYVLKYMGVFISARNGLFVGMLFLSLGIFVAKLIKEKRISFRTNSLVLFLSAIIFVLEVIFLRNKAYLDDHALYISFIFLIPALVVTLSSIKLNIALNYKLMRDYSVSIYLLHRPVLFLVEKYLLLENRIYVFIVVSIFCIIISFIVFRINNKSLNRFFK